MRVIKIKNNFEELFSLSLVQTPTVIFIADVEILFEVNLPVVFTSSRTSLQTFLVICEDCGEQCVEKEVKTEDEIEDEEDYTVRTSEVGGEHDVREVGCGQKDCHLVISVRDCGEVHIALKS